MYLKKHAAEGRIIVAICDENILGKTFREKGMKLEVSETFYKGVKIDKARAKEEMQHAESLNLAGEETMQTALEAEIITKDHIKKIGGIPFALVFEL